MGRIERACRHFYQMQVVKNIYGTWTVRVCAFCGLCRDLKRC